jgi:transcriptional pleiotropic regulator of transition state genes
LQEFAKKGRNVIVNQTNVKEVILMKPAGIVRKLDQLGRIVLPKPLRKRYQMIEGTPLEILVEGENIILEKFRPKCVFCASVEQVSAFKEKYVCAICVNELDGFR